MEAIEREKKNTDDQYDDAAYHLLTNIPLADSVKSEVWDAYWLSDSTQGFARAIAHLDVPKLVWDALVSARSHRKTHDAVISAIEYLRKIDPEILSAIERHPDLLRMMIGAAEKRVGAVVS